MTIAANKTKGLIIKSKLRGRPPALRLAGHSVHFVAQAQYLGVTLDYNFSFLPHVKNIGNKAKELFGKLTRLIKIKYSVKTSKLNFLY